MPCRRSFGGLLPEVRSIGSVRCALSCAIKRDTSEIYVVSGKQMPKINMFLPLMSVGEDAARQLRTERWSWQRRSEQRRMRSSIIRDTMAGRMAEPGTDHGHDRWPRLQPVLLPWTKRISISPSRRTQSLPEESICHLPSPGFWQGHVKGKGKVEEGLGGLAQGSLGEPSSHSRTQVCLWIQCFPKINCQRHPLT